MLIGATRCSVICESTVLLETQRPCESVRKCSADTVTDDTRARVENVTPVTLGFIFARCAEVHVFGMSTFWWRLVMF